MEPTKFSPLVVSSLNNSKAQSPHKDGDEVEEFVPTAEFKPVVDKLPDLIEVKTGKIIPSSIMSNVIVVIVLRRGKL